MKAASASAHHHPKVIQAFSLAVGIFGAFLVSDEFFIVYDRLPAIETTHLIILCALLLSFLAISVLSNMARAA